MGDRAEEFRSAVEAQGPLSPAGVVAIEEVCRLIRRSDRLDALLTGDLGSWLELNVGEDRVVVVVSSVLTEARQTAAEIRQQLQKLDLAPAAEASKPEGGRVFEMITGGKTGGKRTG